MFADILVEYTNKAIDKTFTYLVPNNLKDIIKVGMKVKVPFGNKLINGIVLKLKKSYDGEYELKSIKEVITPEIALNKELLSLGKYLSDKTLCSKIVAYQTMLPSALKVKNQEHNYNKYETFICLNKEVKIIDEYINNNQRSKVQIDILNKLKSNKLLKNELSSSAVKKLLDLNLVKEEYIQKYRINHTNNNIKKIKLNDDQINVINKVNLNDNKTYLLYGVTASGKTEVYMNLIESVIKDGKTAIMLLPEISLTTQMINRFYDRFSNSVAIFHSALSDGEKYDEYLKIIRKEVSIVIGTRSAIFTPLENIGIIIIDEEHSENYHQDTNPRYSAIDMAKFRCAYNKCPLVLGSATPTLESMVRAKKGVYELLELPNRVNNQKLPEIKIINMQEEYKKGRTIISEELENKIRDRLEKKEQVILLLNRRGFSTIVSCKSCGYTYKCPHCDITLTYHKTNNTMRCHYCGYTKIIDETCPECKLNALSFLGLGTEKLESSLNKIFEGSKIIRMDVDTTSKKGSHEKIIKDFKDHKYDILLGTQMISKGLDFPLVTLVGVINADASLNIPDFRSGERTFELLSQVSGRAGRDKVSGEVIIESFNPDNIYLECVKENSYEKFYNYEMISRRKLKYPPYYYLVNVKIHGKNLDETFKEATNVYKYLKKNLAIETNVFNPTPASILRVNNTYRYQILIKYRYDGYLITTLKKLDEMYANNRNIDFMVDFNPSRF